MVVHQKINLEIPMILSFHSGMYLQKYRNQEHEQMFVHHVPGAMVHDSQKAEAPRVSVSGWWTLTVWFSPRAVSGWWTLTVRFSRRAGSAAGGHSQCGSRVEQRQRPVDTRSTVLA